MWAAEVLGHGETLAGLWRALEQERLAHALLFHGPEGVGKFLAARRFAQGLFCTAGPGPPCGNCGPCKRLAAESHPDIFVLDPGARELETITVGNMTRRDQGPTDPIDGFLALRPAEGGWRIVIVREFDRANVAAQNALLKTLEEPGESALLILETSRPDLLLETVRSRCVSVAFDALTAEDCSEVLRRAGSDGGDRESYVRWSAGSPGRALALEHQNAAEIRAIIARVLGGSARPLEATTSLLEVEGDFPGKTAAAQRRARTRAALDMALCVLRDTLHSRSGAACEGLAHGDLVAGISWSSAALAVALDDLLALRGEVELNLAPESILDRALMVLAGRAVGVRGGTGSGNQR